MLADLFEILAMSFRRVGITLAILVLTLAAFQAQAQAQTETSTCLAIARHDPGPTIWRASLIQTQLQSDEVKITYVGHSAFRIETPKGVNVITDYNGYHGEGGLPQVVTMNHAHSSHYTPFPDPEIEHVLRGWVANDVTPAEHRLRLDDIYIRNVPTDLYSGGALVEEDGNSIFIFEVAGLCIAHLGHLHHKLTPDHIANIGRIDILFVPVDGTYTMSQAGMIELSQQLRSSIVIPMHFFSTFSLQRFLEGVRGDFEVEMAGSDEMTVSLRSLPDRPTVSVLNPF